MKRQCDLDFHNRWPMWYYRETWNNKFHKMKKFSLLPEFNLVFFSFLLNFTWEVLQTPFFDDRGEEFTTILWYRIHCTLGDILITLGCFWLVSIIFRSRAWFLSLTRNKILLFIGLGVIYTVFSEIRNVRIIQSWGYSELMPVMPFIGVGLVPVLQWIVVPLLLILILKRQLSWYFKQYALHLLTQSPKLFRKIFRHDPYFFS